MSMPSVAESVRYRLPEDAQPHAGGRAPADAPSRFDAWAGRRRESSHFPSQHATFTRTESASWSPVPAGERNVAVEQYRRLAAALIQAQVERGVRVIMVTSSVAQEGKSLTVANLAVTLARSYQRRTLVIDADSRAPSLHAIFRVSNAYGLTDYLRAAEDVQVPAIQLQDALTLLPAGRPTMDPMGGLTSARMARLIADAAETFDFTLIDTPPAAQVPDAGILAQLADATLLVVGAASTPHAVIKRAVAVLGKERILGTVLNRAERAGGGRYGYGYGYGHVGQ